MQTRQDRPLMPQMIIINNNYKYYCNLPDSLKMFEKIINDFHLRIVKIQKSMCDTSHIACLQCFLHDNSTPQIIAKKPPGRPKLCPKAPKKPPMSHAFNRAGMRLRGHQEAPTSGSRCRRMHSRRWAPERFAITWHME